jgi:hypothetical protein
MVLLFGFSDGNSSLISFHKSSGIFLIAEDILVLVSIRQIRRKDFSSYMSIHLEYTPSHQALSIDPLLLLKRPYRFSDNNKI